MKALNVPKLVLATLTTVMLTACGSSGVTGKPSTTTVAQGNDTGQIFLPPVGADSAAYPFSFSTSGTTPSTATTALKTDTKLLVKVNADSATRNQSPVYTNFAAEYHCAVFKVTLQMDAGNGTYTDLGSVITNSLNVAGTAGCSGGVASQVIDFSAFMTPGHGNVKIKVESMKTDFYCILFNKCVAFKNQYGFWSSDCAWASPSNMEMYACPTKTIYQYHVVNGSLEVQVNGTNFVR